MRAPCVGARDAASLAADVTAEQQKISDSFGKYGRFYPVVQLGTKYRF